MGGTSTRTLTLACGLAQVVALRIRPAKPGVAAPHRGLIHSRTRFESFCPCRIKRTHPDGWYINTDSHTRLRARSGRGSAHKTGKAGRCGAPPGPDSLPNPVRVLLPLPYKKNPPGWVGFFLAGAEGLEPSRTVLETAMLPLHHAPNKRRFRQRKQYSTPVPYLSNEL